MIARLRRRDDGATLIIVLIIVTVIAVVMGVVLSLVDTNVRASVELSDQANTDYGVDGAAQVAIKQLQKGTFLGTNCQTTATESVPFNNWVPSSSSDPGASMAVRCSPNPTTGSGAGGGANSSPGSAILTLGTGAGGERGIYLNDSANESVKVKGGVFSNSTIFLEGNKSDLENTNTTNSYVYAMSTCSSNGTSKIISTPAAVCNYSANPASAIDRRGKDPGTIAGHGASFDAPAAPIANGTVAPAACAAQAVYEFQPGLYTSAAALNAMTDTSASCQGSVWHFNPGVYFFNFQDASLAHQWRISSGYLVGGTANVSGALNRAKIVTLESSNTPFCVAPVVGGTTANTGVEFVFGGDSRMYVARGTASNNPNVQICASNATAGGPPIAIYGLKTAVGSGSFAVPAQSGCITQTGYTALGGDASHCAVVLTTNDPQPALTIYGTTYVPAAIIDLYLNNRTVQVFRWGLVARGVLVGASGSPNLASAVISVPDDAPAPFPTPSILYLDVFVCPGQSTCSASGTLTLKIKVQVDASAGTASVLSWSRQS